MYPTFTDTQQCILNDKDILTQVVVKWKREQLNNYPQILEIGEVGLQAVHNPEKKSTNVDN